MKERRPGYIRTGRGLWTVLVLYAVLIAGVGCSTDCIYKFFNDSSGEEKCGSFCPKKDAEGNDLLNSKGEIVYDEPEEVQRINCEFPDTARTTASGTPTATATVSATATATATVSTTSN